MSLPWLSAPGISFRPGNVLRSGVAEAELYGDSVYVQAVLVQRIVSVDNSVFFVDNNVGQVAVGRQDAACFAVFDINNFDAGRLFPEIAGRNSLPKRIDASLAADDVRIVEIHFIVAFLGV